MAPAHFIRDRKTITAKAIFSLKADRRWAMTGTPVQNSLNDFSSLLEYLRVHPFNEPGAFDRCIQKPWKEGNSQEAVDRLKRLVHCIVLRRSKKAIQLPERHDHIRCIEFTPEEHSYYKEVSCPIEKMLDTLVQQQPTQRGQYLNVIQRINVLRMICNLGASCESFSQERPSTLSLTATWSSSTAQESFELLLNIGEAVCTNCSTEVISTIESSRTLSVPTFCFHVSSSVRESFAPLASPKQAVPEALALRLQAAAAFQRVHQKLSGPTRLPDSLHRRLLHLSHT